jgi:hypothetical protein
MVLHVGTSNPVIHIAQTNTSRFASPPQRCLPQEVAMTADTQEARHLLAAAIKRVHDIDDAIRAIAVAANLVSEQLTLIESGMLAALEDISDG